MNEARAILRKNKFSLRLYLLLFLLTARCCWGFLYVLFHLAFYLALLYCSACEDEVFLVKRALFIVFYENIFLKYRNKSFDYEIAEFSRTHNHMITYSNFPAHSCTHFSLNSQIKYRLQESERRGGWNLYYLKSSRTRVKEAKKNR